MYKLCFKLLALTEAGLDVPRSLGKPAGVIVELWAVHAAVSFPRLLGQQSSKHLGECLVFTEDGLRCDFISLTLGMMNFAFPGMG